MLERAHRATQHRPDKNAGANIPPGVPLKNENPVASSFSAASNNSNCHTNCPCIAWSTIA